MSAAAALIDRSKTGQELITKSLSIREMLRNPPNAVPDTPINIERPRGLNGYQAEMMAAARRDEIKKAAQRAEIKKKIEAAKELAKEKMNEIEIKNKQVIIAFNPDFPIKIRDIQLEVCRQCSVDLIDLISSRRTREVSAPRQIAMALCRKLTLNSLPRIGRAFGGRHHTTILHSCQKNEWLTNSIKSEIDPLASISEWVSRAKILFMAGKPV